MITAIDGVKEMMPTVCRLGKQYHGKKDDIEKQAQVTEPNDIITIYNSTLFQLKLWNSVLQLNILLQPSQKVSWILVVFQRFFF